MKEKWPEEFWEIRSGEEFMRVVAKYDRRHHYWNTYLYTLLKYYCVPDTAVRRGCLENIILTANKLIS